MRPLIQTALSFLVLFLATYSYANGSINYSASIGIEAQKLQNEEGESSGWNVGTRLKKHFTQSDVYMGFSLYVGNLRGSDLTRDHITYGGGLLGVDGKILSTFVYDMGILAGYGFGAVEPLNLSGQGIALQPSTALGLLLKSNIKASFAAGYFFFPSQTEFSTFTFGIRLEFLMK